MVFSSISFIFLILPLFVLFDALARQIKYFEARNIALLLVSLLFYIWGEATNVYLLLGLGVFNYFAGIWIAKSPHARLLLISSIAVNLLILIGFKYTYWLSSMFFPGLLQKKISLPLGISFFTFHAISYLIDVFRKTIAPAKSAMNFLTYFCMFPHLVAGPIVRYAQVQDDLKRRGPGRELFAFGVYRFLLGLNKKVLLANTVSILADRAFAVSGSGNLSAIDAWVGILAYTVQIYFDFSGYSDMAIGLAAMAGFHFEENFKRPYSSKSIREFWRRWHISLSNWLRDYLYIPLGGSRVNPLTTYRNLIIVFFVCGLWHGADITFILWGLWYGVFLVLERLPWGRFLEKMPVAVCRAYTLLVVIIGWVLFRAENIGSATTYLGELFTLQSGPLTFSYFTIPCVALAAGLLICLVPDKCMPAADSHRPGAYSTISLCVQLLLAAISVAMLLLSVSNPFIYFNF